MNQRWLLGLLVLLDDTGRGLGREISNHFQRPELLELRSIVLHDREVLDGRHLQLGQLGVADVSGQRTVQQFADAQLSQLLTELVLHLVLPQLLLLLLSTTVIAIAIVTRGRGGGGGSGGMRMTVALLIDSSTNLRVVRVVHLLGEILSQGGSLRGFQAIPIASTTTTVIVAAAIGTESLQESEDGWLEVVRGGRILRNGHDRGRGDLIKNPRQLQENDLMIELIPLP